MAFFLFFVLIPSAILLLSILMMNILKSSKTNPKLPPGSTGWPIVGESLAFAVNPEKFIHDRMTKHSPKIFQTSIAGDRMAVLCGPLGNKFLFSNDNKSIKPWWPKSVTKALFFETSYLSSISEDHSFLKLESIQHYVPRMDLVAKVHLESKWAPYNLVKVHPLAKQFTFSLACQLFLNYIDDQVRALVKPFVDVARGIVATRVNFPGTPFYEAVKGGKVIKGKLLDIIRQRKMEMRTRGDKIEKHNQDLLSKLVLACDKNGKFYSEEEIANKIIGYIVASFYTTSSAITFVVGQLAEHPRVYDRVLEEQLEIAKTKEEGELLSWADIQKMKYSWNVVCETMRLIPPSPGGFREFLADISFAGFNIPKGWKALWTVHSTNKNPKYYPNPEKFDPTRFEGNGPPPFTYVPFGGGPHMCAGKEYARIEILAFVHNVVTMFKLKKVNPNEKIIYNPEPIPVEGLPLCLQLR